MLCAQSSIEANILKKYKLNKKGFSLIELLIALTILAIIVAISSDTFKNVLEQAGREMGIMSTQMDSFVGLGMLTYDIEHAGYGLPESFRSTISYNEASTSPANAYNDAPSGIPRPFVSGNNTGLNGSDYFVIKSILAATNNVCTKWTYITFENKPFPKTWSSSSQNLVNGNRVIVIKPAKDIYSSNELILDADGNFYTTFNSANFSSDFSPQNQGERYMIYGVDASTDLRMPFNRTDYYIKVPTTSSMSLRCAPNTGILYKAMVNHANGELNEMPILDCVADMQVIFGLDSNEDGVVETYSDDISSLTANQIRKRVKEVRIYILTHEGGKDNSYIYPTSTISVGEFGKGREFNLSSTIGTSWQNYRWKQHIIVVKPKDL